MKTPVAACARELPTLGSKAGFGGKVSRAASRALPQGVGAALVLRRLEDVNPRRQNATYPDDVLFYGVVSAQTEKVVEFFLGREAAEAMIDEVREDEPLLAEELRVEAIELG